MPIIVYELDNGLGNLIYAEGEISGEEYYEETMKHLNKPDEQLQKYIYSIVDYTNVTKAQVGLHHLTKVAKKSIEVAKINPDVIVVIAVSNNTIYGLAKIWSSLAKLTGWTMAVYRSREQADEWLKKKIKGQHGDIDLTYSE